MKLTALFVLVGTAAFAGLAMLDNLIASAWARCMHADVTYDEKSKDFVGDA